MKITKVWIAACASTTRLETLINRFISENPTRRIIDIKFSMSECTDSGMGSISEHVGALIIYEEDQR